MESLQDRIDMGILRSELDGTDFLPQSALDDLITVATVDAELRLNNLSPSLSRTICEDSKRVFTILTCIGMVGAVLGLQRDGFDDRFLPVALVDNEGQQEMVSSSGNQAFAAFSQAPWNRTKRRDFFHKQWIVLSPVFGVMGQELEIQARCPLPIIFCERKPRGMWSVLYKIKIHHSHLTNSNRFPSDGDEPYFALKETDRDQNALTEARNLRKIGRFGSKYLTHAIAIIHRGIKYYYLFPWAEGGNLRMFWENTQSVLTVDLVSWVLRQILGLAEALRLIHDPGDHSFGRHGDLKPENILVFHDYSDTGATRREVLRIADFGLLRFHDKETNQRQSATKTMTGTRMYEPPETDTRQGDPRSRKYDTWAFGCILLEFLSWLLYGPEEVDRFRQRRTAEYFATGSHKFYVITQSDQGQPSDAEVHPEVCNWLRQVAKDPRCVGDTAFHDILTVIEKCLCVNVSARAGSSELYDWFNNINTKAQMNKSYILNEAGLNFV